jgi:hypothetical protein
VVRENTIASNPAAGVTWSAVTGLGSLEIKKAADSLNRFNRTSSGFSLNRLLGMKKFAVRDPGGHFITFAKQVAAPQH